MEETSQINQSEVPLNSRKMPQIGWALANIVYLATACDISCPESGKFAAGLDYALYLDVVILLADNLLASLENFSLITRQNEEIQPDKDTLAEFDLLLGKTTCRFSKLSYMDHFMPVCKQWHLKKLLDSEKDACLYEINNLPSGNPDYSRKVELLDIALYYSCMLRLFSTLNPVLKSLPLLNMLSFAPGFLFSLWEQLEKSLCPGKNQSVSSKSVYANSKLGGNGDIISERRQKKFSRDTGNKWVNVLHKITGKTLAENDHANTVNDQSNICQIEEHPDEWNVELLRQGPGGISKDISCLLHLFCSGYSHLLLVLDDIEFYDKQVFFWPNQFNAITYCGCDNVW